MPEEMRRKLFAYPPRVARALARHYHADQREYPDLDHWLVDERGSGVVAQDIVVWIEQAVAVKP